MRAGHAVANAFLGVIGSSHFQGLSIIPNHNYLGVHHTFKGYAVRSAWRQALQI